MTDFGNAVARVFHMDEQTWERHASPWSVWTRVATMPFLLLAIWSHVWLGIWALVPLALVIVWLWVNPRLFPPPEHTDTWSARAVLGERVWLNRKAVPIPAHHARAALILATISMAGFLPALAGAWLNNALMTVAGGAVALLAKMWFCDRMVWLYDDMAPLHPPYAGWLRTRKEVAR